MPSCLCMSIYRIPESDIKSGPENQNGGVQFYYIWDNASFFLKFQALSDTDDLSPNTVPA